MQQQLAIYFFLHFLDMHFTVLVSEWQFLYSY